MYKIKRKVIKGYIPLSDKIEKQLDKEYFEKMKRIKEILKKQALEIKKVNQEMGFDTLVLTEKGLKKVIK